MIGCCNSVGGKLPVGFQKGYLSGHGHTGTRHNLAFKRVTMNIDKCRSQKPSTAIDYSRPVARHVYARNEPVFDAQVGGFNFFI